MLSVPMKIGIVRMRTELGLSFAWIFKKNTDVTIGDHRKSTETTAIQYHFV